MIKIIKNFLICFLYKKYNIYNTNRDKGIYIIKVIVNPIILYNP